ncbi:MAG TPA: drug/metabolite exporter YedA, partial [Longimicrobiaceae bacterium]|nr:drug/metabolite exporter YedA [Longimicrobiaceae bacterium]
GGGGGGGGPPRAQVLLAFAAVYLVWGSTYVAIRFAIETLPPFLMAGARFVISGVALYLLARGGQPAPTRAQWRATAIVGACLLLGGNGGVVWAEQHVPSGIAALLVATVPLWMVLLEWRAGRVRPRPGVFAGLVLGFAGVAILMGPGQLLGGRGVHPVGAVVLVLASLSWAAGSVYSRRAPLPASQFLGTGMEMLAGGALLLLAGTVAGEWARLDLAAVTPRSWLAFLYLIVFGSGVGFTAYIWLLRHVSIAKVATYAYVNPVVAVLLGWALAGEALSARTALAAAVIIAAVVFITTSRRTQASSRRDAAGMEEGPTRE